MVEIIVFHEKLCLRVFQVHNDHEKASVFKKILQERTAEGMYDEDEQADVNLGIESTDDTEVIEVMDRHSEGEYETYETFVPEDFFILVED